MRLPRIALIGALLSFQVARAELSLVPQTEDGEGRANLVFYSDGKKRYTLRIDGDTKVSSEGGGTLFRFTNVSQASMRLIRSPFAPPPDFTPESAPGYLQAAKQMLPRSAEEIALVSEQNNVLPVNGWQSRRFTYTYRIAGISSCESITFLNMDPKFQVVIRTAGLQKDFAGIASRANDIMRRWDEVQPGDNLNLN